MRIGEVAAKAGVNQQTLRFYERQGVLPAPTRNRSGYREYPLDTVALVRFIKRAQDLGFTLAEAKDLSVLHPSGVRDRPRVRALAEAKLVDVRQRLVDLRAIEQALATLVVTCCEEGARCAILDAIADPASPVPSSRRSQ
jgi:DNA-binding transcriptional MerR regulator